ncbi:MAG: hypothetical protein K6G54_08755 [Oscillospiraceae bacterium]|nr:hypothetical protein [Oscillospiraceae bacterium]
MEQDNTRNADAVATGAVPETAAEETAQPDFAARDLAVFLARHADVDAAALLDNARFVRFCGTRMGREYLADLYDDYAALVDEVTEAALEREKSRARRSTGGGAAGGVPLTPGQKQRLDAWNAAHPEMAMTAREFMGR